MKKRTYKNVVMSGLALIAVLGLTGCGKKEVTLDVTEVSNRLLEEITYQDELSSIDLDTAAMIFNFSEVNITNGAVFESSGATAEEIVVLECATAKDADAAKAALEARIADQKESFTDYVPQELVKLDKAVIVENGNYAILSVSDEPDKALEIIGNYTK
ncbi:MAG: DUF4358 domain-containing protein [Lachnospiraceae bacterium]